MFCGIFLIKFASFYYLFYSYTMDEIEKKSLDH